MTLRSLVFTALRFLKGGRGRALPDRGQLRVLVFQHERIGDYVVTTPMYHWLSQRPEGVTIDVIASDLNAELVALDPHLNDRYILPWKESTLWDLIQCMRWMRRYRYDLILVTTFTSRTRNAMLCALAKGRPCCATFSDHDRAAEYGAFFDTVAIRRRFQEHVSVPILRTAMLALGERSEPNPQPYVVSRGVRAPYIMINTLTRDPARNWTVEQAEWLRSELQSCFPELDVNIAHEVPTLQDLVDLYANARLVISADSAPVHIAAAANVPVVALFNARPNSTEWYPLGTDRKRVLVPETDGRTSDIRKEVVFEAAVELLRVNNSDGPSA